MQFLPFGDVLCLSAQNQSYLTGTPIRDAMREKPDIGPSQLVVPAI